MIILLMVALICSLQLKPVQTFVAKKAAKYLSKELKTVITIKSLYIVPFKSVVLEELYVQDRDKDTLLYSPDFTVDLNAFSIEKRRIGISELRLDNGKFYLKSYKGGGNNIKFIIDYFKPKPTPGPKAPPYNITIDKVVLANISFKYRNFSKDNALKRINFNDLDLTQLSTTLLKIDTKKHTFDAQVNQLRFREKSGFRLINLTTKATIDTNRMEFKGLYLETPNSKLSDYLLMRFGKFSDFKQFAQKVYVKINLKQSRLHSKDITFFTDATRKMNLDVRLRGNLNGYLNHIRARNFFLSAGQATYLKGNFTIKGLPKISDTYLDLRFNQLHTNDKDVLFLAKAAGATPPKLPPITQKLGHVSFNGMFRGLIKNFNVRGEVKTALGRIYSDLNLSLNGTPTYSGNVKAYDFNLQELLGKNDFGRTTLTAKIQGKGFNLKSLSENIQAEAAYFDYRGYRYSNITINGTYNKHFFLGKAIVRDRNIHLNFDGGINFDLEVPEFQFVAQLRHTKFHKLGFSKDTIELDADIRTNFSGTNINNIEGNFAVRNVRLTRADTALFVDSIDLVASGKGTSRSLEIKSDILDAGIKGQYALQELPNYFKSVVKQYIPSLNLSISSQKMSVQIFDISLKLKNFAPIAAVLIPELKIPEGATFYGQFNSATKMANVNGSITSTEYKNIKINRLIIDESTTEQALNIIATADRLDVGKVYIQNINVANILKNDSLALNIKLSDKDAANQLDLNGLVEFAADTAAKLALLPSDVVINKEAWRIQDKVRLKFDKSKVYIEGFELFRDNQLLTVDGVISPDPEDVLNVGFNQFKLSTFNPLTAGSKVVLGGMLNGHFTVNTPLKKPKIESDIRIDSLTLNTIPIGELTLTANMDNESKIVEVDMNILKQGKETLFLSGTYNANSENDKLNLDLIMNKSEAIIFQPFIKNLVSNLDGNVSASLLITGTPGKPVIRGHANLDNVGLTVNYLKTHYTINDSVSVRNSIIHLNDLEITDIYGSKAIANGTVDMNNPKIPVIHVDVDASNFQALNTTSKDNPLYYGTAYGTGTFSFNGPTNRMAIKIKAKTEERTVFNIPLNSAERVGNSNFLIFAAKDSTLKVPAFNSFSGLEMNFELNVGESTIVNIITDVGKLRGNGTANPLVLNINNAGKFEMRGEYQISGGKFTFTAQDYLNKQFDIYSGGTIRWIGDPTQAQINLNAAYRITASLKNLYTAANSPGTPPPTAVTEAIINLQGLLTQPKINVDLNFPNDGYIKDELSSYLSNVDNLRTQAFSIIVRRSFSANTDLKETTTETIISAGTELTSSILNSIIAQSLNLKSVDINIRTLGDFGLSWQPLDGRLRITGGLRDNRSISSSFYNFNSSTGSANYTRDVEAQYLIKKDGALIAKASNRPNSRNIFNSSLTSEYINALGLVYRKDFDSFGEFLRAMVGQQRRNERKQTPSIPAPIQPTTPTTITPGADKSTTVLEKPGAGI